MWALQKHRCQLQVTPLSSQGEITTEWWCTITRWEHPLFTETTHMPSALCLAGKLLTYLKVHASPRNLAQIIPESKIREHLCRMHCHTAMPWGGTWGGAWWQLLKWGGQQNLEEKLSLKSNCKRAYTYCLKLGPGNRWHLSRTCVVTSTLTSSSSTVVLAATGEDFAKAPWEVRGGKLVAGGALREWSQNPGTHMTLWHQGTGAVRQEGPMTREKESKEGSGSSVWLHPSSSGQWGWGLWQHGQWLSVESDQLSPHSPYSSWWGTKCLRSLKTKRCPSGNPLGAPYHELNHQRSDKMCPLRVREQSGLSWGSKSPAPNDSVIFTSSISSAGKGQPISYN